MANMYRYEGLEAELYDRLDELSGFGDVDFYRWFAESGPGPALDVGCGTGRVLLPLVEAGLEVVGVDGSPEMLALCRSALAERGLSAELREGDMRDFEAGDRRFGTAMVPGFSIQLLDSEAAVEACLRSCRRHLVEGGQLILPTHLPWEMIWDGREEAPMEERRRVADETTGGALVASQGWRIDKRDQRLVLRNRYERRDASGRSLASEEKAMTLRWWLPHEMLERLAAAGFEDVSVYGDFGFEPPEADSEAVIFLARC